MVSVSPIGDSPDAEIPVCTGGARACPPEDVSGVWDQPGRYRPLPIPTMTGTTATKSGWGKTSIPSASTSRQ